MIYTAKAIGFILAYSTKGNKFIGPKDLFVFKITEIVALILCSIII